MVRWDIGPPTSVIFGDIYACGPDLDSFNITNFEQAPMLRRVRDASLSGQDVELVSGGGHDAGAIWTLSKVPVVKGFSTAFSFELFDFDSDGISFVIQNIGAAPPLSPGGLMGYEGMKNSFAVELDTFLNPPNNDQTSREVSIHTRGPTIPNSAHEDYSIAGATDGGGNMTLGTHTMGVRYDADAHVFEVRIDGNLRISIPLNLETTLSLDDGKAYIGIIATRGAPGVTDGPAFVFDWSADFITSPAAADLRLVRVTGNRIDSGAAIEEIELGGIRTFEDFEGGFTEWGQPDAYPFQLEQQGDANPTRGEYPRSFDVYFDQVVRQAPNDNLSAPFRLNIEAFVEGGFDASNYAIAWARETGSTPAGRLIASGFTATLEFDDGDPPGPGLYRFRCELRRGEEEFAPLHRRASISILLPYAGPEIADWLIEEARQIALPGGVGAQWLDHVDNNAEFWTIIGLLPTPLASQFLDFKNRAFTSVSWNYFDYTGHTTFDGVPPTPRFNFDDFRRASDDPLKDNKAFNDPSYATLNGLVVARQKITNLLWALWGRSVGYSLPTLIAGSNANNLQKGKFEDKSSNNSVKLGSALYQAIVDDKSNAEIFSAVLTRTATRGIQTDGDLNDIRLWPRPDSVAPPHTALWSYDPETETTANLDDGVTWTRPDIFRQRAEMDLLPLTNP
jgi:hypothetical protein